MPYESSLFSGCCCSTLRPLGVQTRACCQLPGCPDIQTPCPLARRGMQNLCCQSVVWMSFRGDADTLLRSRFQGRSSEMNSVGDSGLVFASCVGGSKRVRSYISAGSSPQSIVIDHTAWRHTVWAPQCSCEPHRRCGWHGARGTDLLRHRDETPVCLLGWGWIGVIPVARALAVMQPGRGCSKL